MSFAHVLGRQKNYNIVGLPIISGFANAKIKKEPYYGRKIDGRDQGPVLGVWELDLRSEFPLLFVEKEVRVKIPHSEEIGRAHV